MEDRGAARWIAGALGVLTTAIGVWSLVGPRSFYDAIATFEPYNEHFLHDIGAFQIGLGVALLLALRVSDGLLVALGGYAAAGVVHAIAHMVDSELGGRPTDVPAITALALLAIVAYAVRGGALRRRDAAARQPT